VGATHQGQASVQDPDHIVKLDRYVFNTEDGRLGSVFGASAMEPNKGKGKTGMKKTLKLTQPLENDFERLYIPFWDGPRFRGYSCHQLSFELAHGIIEICTQSQAAGL